MQINKKRNFNLMVLGQIISLFGANILRFALSLYVLDITGRADVFATIFAISSIPGIFLSPIGGAIADRANRRNLMVIFDFTSSAIVLFLFLSILNGNISTLFIGVIMTLLSIISTMYQPTVQASIPVLSEPENLVKANGIVNGVMSLAGLAGPVIGGILYNMLGLHTLVILSCISFFLSAVMEIFIQMPHTKQEKTGPILSVITGDMKKGFSYVLKQNPFILKVMVFAAVLNMLMTPLFIIGSPFILRITLATNDFVYGLSMGIIQFSSILGALLIGKFEKQLRKDNIHWWLAIIASFMLPMALGMTPFILSFGFVPAFTLYMGFSIPVLMCTQMISIFALTIIQKETPNHLLGKVMAIVMAAAQIAAPLGQLAYGKLFEVFKDNAYIPIAIACICCLLFTFVAKKMFPKEQPVAAEVLAQ